ncbi:hypothetical protein ACFLQP_00495 [Acidobacteriota bacterium]
MNNVNDILSEEEAIRLSVLIAKVDHLISSAGEFKEEVQNEDNLLKIDLHKSNRLIKIAADIIHSDESFAKYRKGGSSSADISEFVVLEKAKADLASYFKYVELVQKKESLSDAILHSVNLQKELFIQLVDDRKRFSSDIMQIVEYSSKVAETERKDLSAKIMQIAQLQANQAQANREQFSSDMLEIAEKQARNSEDDRRKSTKILNKMIWPILAAVIIAIASSVFTSIFQLNSFKKQRTFSADYDRAVYLMGKVSEIESEAYELDWNFERDNMRKVRANSYLTRVRKLDSIFTEVISSIRFSISKEANRIKIKSRIEIVRFMCHISALYDNNWNYHNEEYSKYIESIGVEDLSQEEVEELKKFKLSPENVDIFDPSIFHDFTSETRKLLYKKLGGSVFIED